MLDSLSSNSCGRRTTYTGLPGQITLTTPPGSSAVTSSRYRSAERFRASTGSPGTNKGIGRRGDAQHSRSTYRAYEQLATADTDGLAHGRRPPLSGGTTCPSSAALRPAYPYAVCPTRAALPASHLGLARFPHSSECSALHVARSAARGRCREPQKYDQSTIEACEVLVIEPPNACADTRFRNR